MVVHRSCNLVLMDPHFIFSLIMNHFIQLFFDIDVTVHTDTVVAVVVCQGPFVVVDYAMTIVAALWFSSYHG
jgi:hypothetical protein